MRPDSEVRSWRTDHLRSALSNRPDAQEIVAGSLPEARFVPGLFEQAGAGRGARTVLLRPEQPAIGQLVFKANAIVRSSGRGRRSPVSWCPTGTRIVRSSDRECAIGRLAPGSSGWGAEKGGLSVIGL
jgi:hypothetical protein